MRTFVALSAPEGWIAPLIRAQGLVPGGRRVDADDLHLTLAFLDDQPEDRLEALHETLEARALPAATLRAVAWAVIGSGKPRALVLDVAPEPGLVALREAVRGACRTACIALSRERFRPHVTLARFGATAPADAHRLSAAMARLGPPDMAQAGSEAVILWSSHLTPQGPHYETIATYPLRAA